MLVDIFIYYIAHLQSKLISKQITKYLYKNTTNPSNLNNSNN